MIRIHSPEAHRSVRLTDTFITAARDLVNRSGGASLLPRLCEAEARVTGRRDARLALAGLREAEALYRASGAPEPANRLARELGN